MNAFLLRDIPAPVADYIATRARSERIAANVLILQLLGSAIAAEARALADQAATSAKGAANAAACANGTQGADAVAAGQDRPVAPGDPLAEAALQALDEARQAALSIP